MDMEKGKRFLGPLFVLAMSFSAVLSSGCMPERVRTHGLVAWNYKSVVPTGVRSQPVAPVSLRIRALEKAESAEGRSSFLVALPIACLFAPPTTYTNLLPGDLAGSVQLHQDEVEKILAREIGKTGLVNRVTYEGPPQDFDIGGSVELSLDEHLDCWGQGTVLGWPLAVIVPCGRWHFRCKLHLDIVTPDGSKKIFSKDYFAERKHWGWIYSRPRIWNTYGRQLFPRIVGQFVTDLKAIPPSAWRK